MTDILGKRRRKVHRCGNCIMWLESPGGLTGICEIGDLQPLPGFDGNGADTDDGFRTTPDTYCDYQVPIPPPGPPCPKCGAPVVDGYGLMGGGCGVYAFCEAAGCDYFEKWPDMDDETWSSEAQPIGPEPALATDALTVQARPQTSTPEDGR